MKRNGVAVCVATAILAVSVVMADALPTFAAEATKEVTQETAQAATETNVEQDVNGSVSGVSKVIGLKGTPSVYTMSSDDKTVNRKYAYTNYDECNAAVYASGKAEEYRDSLTGYYKVGNDLYTAASAQSESVVKFSKKIAWYGTVEAGASSSGIKPTKNAHGVYEINGRYFRNCYSKSVKEKDAQGNSVVVRTVYYAYASDELVWFMNLSEQVANSDAIYDPMNRICGKKLSASDAEYSYYEANGKYYKVGLVCDTNSNGTYTVNAIYFYKKNEITFDSCYQKVSWNTVTNDTEVDINGKYLSVGYQVKVNGEMVTLDDFVTNGSEVQPMTTEASYRNPVLRPAGESAKYEVRALYYTTNTTMTRDPQTQEEVTIETKNVVKTGAWSEVYTYAWTGVSTTVPAVSNLTATQRSTEKVELSWDKVNEASAYRLESIYSVEPITDFAAVEEQWSKHVVTNIIDTTYQVWNNDFGTTTVTDANGQSQKVDYKYVYFRVAAYITYDSQAFANSYGPYSNIVCVAENAVANTPTVTGVTVENKSYGGFSLRWNNMDENAMVRVYYSTDKSVFNSQEYLYSLIAAKGLDNKGTETTSDDKLVYLTDTFSLKDKLKIVNKKVNYVDLYRGTNEVSSSKFDLEPGKKYYFVVVTYDDVNYKTDRTAYTPYIANVARVAGETRNVAFGYYKDVAASKVVSAKTTLEMSWPSIKSNKTSISMTFDKSNSGITGFQIYRKSGKKYKKVTTTTSNYVTDTGLKKNTVYDYKARAYYYNPDTKVKRYSDYVYFSAETGVSNYINLKIDKKSKTSVKLNWTKVPGATRYEIYRSNTESKNLTASHKNGYGNGEWTINNAKWELVKTIKKSGTTSYTDKKLKTGQTYSYRIVAYYKPGKTEKSIFSTDSISLKLSEPRDVNATLKGTNVTVTWDKETYASKYQVDYIKYAIDGRAYTDNWVEATTKKTSYTIKNVGAGEYVKIRVRAYGSKKWSDYSSTITEGGKELMSVKKISAKEITETNSNGKTTTAVKISWKKVSGAAYYMVFRMTSPAVAYSTKDKAYFEPDGIQYFISKESNSDENNYYVGYKEYKGQNGTIVGTSAVDRARLRTGVTYYYYVAAYSEDGQCVSQGYSKPASICYKVTPSIKKITAKKGKTVITINKVSGAKKYVIYRSTKKNSGFKKIATSTKTTYTDKTTKKGKSYYYKVVAVGTNGLKADFESGASKVVKVKAK